MTISTMAGQHAGDSLDTELPDDASPTDVEALDAIDERRQHKADRALTAAILLGLLVAWEVAARTYFADRYVLAAPTTIASKMWSDRELLFRNAVPTIKTAIAGYILGNLIAVVCAVVFVLIAPLERVASQITLAAYSLPTLAIAPILGTMLSRSNTRLTVVVLLVFFPTMLAALSGMRSPTPDTISLVRSLGGSNVTIMRKVRLRACLPELFSGLRIAVPMALLGAVASEWLGGVDRGLGIFMVNALGTLQPARVWAICVMCVIITLIGYAIVAAVERRVNRWTGEVQAGTRR